MRLNTLVFLGTQSTGHTSMLESMTIMVNKSFYVTSGLPQARIEPATNSPVGMYCTTELLRPHFLQCDESKNPFLLKLVCRGVDKLGDGRRSRRIVQGFSCEGKVDVRCGQRGCAAVV